MAGSTQLPVRFRRLYAEALDNDYSFTTAQRVSYLGNSLRYAGQVVFDNEEDILYRLNGARNAWIAIAGGLNNTDSLPEGTTNKYFTEAGVLATILVGLSTATSTVVAASDSVLVGFGKLQAQINTLLGRISTTMVYDGTNTKIPTVDAVNNQAKQVATVAVHTGFLRTDDSFTLAAPDQFTLGINIGANHYGIAFSNYFTTAGTAPVDGVKFLTNRTVTFGAGNVGPFLTATDPMNVMLYVGWNMPSDTIVFSAIPYIQSPTICQLGIVFVKKVGGVYSFTDFSGTPARTFLNMPDVAAYSNLLTTTTGVKSSVQVTANTGLTLKHLGGLIQGISVNWAMGGNNDERVVAASAVPMPFTFRSPISGNSATIPSNITTLAGLTDSYWNGSAVTVLANNAAQVMRIMISIRGTIVIQMGETEYATIIAAKSAAFRQAFTEILPKNSYAEIGRLAIKKGTLDLTNLTDAEFFFSGTGGGSGGSGSTATFSTISGSPYDNTLLSAELIKAIAPSEFTLRTDPDIQTTSLPVAIRGYVNTITALYTASDGSVPTSTNFTYNYRVSTTGTWTTGVTLATLNSALANSTLADKIVWVTATNTTNTVPSAVILTVKKYA